MFDAYEAMIDIAKDLGIFIETRTGYQKKQHQKINRRQRHERQRNESQFKDKLNFKHIRYNSDGSELGTINVEDATGDIQIHHHSSKYKHNPMYNYIDSQIHINKSDIDDKSTYTIGAHELSHASDDNKSEGEKEALRNLLSSREKYISMSKDKSLDDRTRDFASKAASATTSEINNKVKRYNERRSHNISDKDHKSKVVRDVQNAVQYITNKTGKSPVDSPHDDKGEEIRADAFVMKNFSNSKNDQETAINRITDKHINTKRNAIINPSMKYDNKLLYDGEIYKEKLKELDRKISHVSNEIFKLISILKNNNDVNLKAKLSKAQKDKKALLNERRELIISYKQHKKDNIQKIKKIEPHIEKIKNNEHELNRNRIHITNHFVNKYKR